MIFERLAGHGHDLRAALLTSSVHVRGCLTRAAIGPDARLDGRGSVNALVG